MCVFYRCDSRQRADVQQTNLKDRAARGTKRWKILMQGADHVENQGHDAFVAVATREVIDGRLPRKAVYWIPAFPAGMTGGSERLPGFGFFGTVG